MQTFCIQSGDIFVFIRQAYLVQILIVGALLLVFGLSAIYSVSIFESFDLTLDLIDK